MHDLLNDLANYVCGDICFRLGVGKARRVPKTSRHFSFASNYKEYFDVFESLHDAKRLRTLFPSTGRQSFVAEPWECRISTHDLFSKFKFLHFLSLSHCSDIREVPGSLGELIHLRSLDLSRTRIDKLPDSTCLLYNLQILKLVDCWRLKELPMKLYKLTNFRCLEFRDSGVRRMPMHFGKLKNLQVLDVFCAGKSSEFSIRQLGGHNLHGKLSIKELQNVEDPSDALAVDLMNQTRLEVLDLEWEWNHIPDDPRKEKEVLANLQPSKHLKYLSIRNYGGTEFASWLSNNSLSNVVSLDMMDCKYCVCLPCLGLLPSLKELSITRFDGIVSIGAEFHGSSSSSFPSLEKLYFEDMKEWEEWECISAFPHLQSLEIVKCPKLKGLSEQLLHVKELHISSCDCLTTFPLNFFPKLCWLRIYGCCNLRMISQERTHTHLKKLSIIVCHKLESMPKRMHILLPSLTDFSIIDCPKVETFTEGGLPSNLKSLNLSSYKLIASLKGILGVNTCLESLCISRVDEVECFPEEGLLPLSLTSLAIMECPNLKKLDYKGLCQLSSLERLNLESCPNLECIPEEGLPKSISTLRICKCPLLKQHCQKPEGQDREKIAHIQNLYITHF